MTGMDNNGGMASAVVTKTAAYVLTTADHIILCDCSGDDVTLTFPDAGVNEGREYIIIRIDTGVANDVIFTPDGADTFVGTPTIMRRGQALRLICDGTSKWYAVGMRGQSVTMTVPFNVFDSDTEIETGNGIVGFVVPSSLDGFELQDVMIAIHTKNGTGGTTDVQVRRRRSGSDVDMLSVKVTLAYNAWFASDGTVNSANDDLNEGDIIFVDVDAIPTGGTTLGLFVTLDLIQEDLY